MQKQKATSEEAAPVCETRRCVKSTKIQTFKQRNKCSCKAIFATESHRCACMGLIKTSLAGCWPHHLACDDGYPPMPPALVTLLKEYRAKLTRHPEEPRLVSTVDLVDFLLFQNERTKGVAHEG
jgi:hypothetical protein